MWEGHCDADLLKHVQDHHSADIDKVAQLLPKSATPDERSFAAYKEAISTTVRQGAPLAKYSIDQRCLYNYTQAMQEDNLDCVDLRDCRICVCGDRVTKRLSRPTAGP